jgi:hypothetical protein
MIIPGYIIGLGCLFIVTYRTIVAYFSETKSIIIFIDKFGEQIFNITVLIIIWTVCLIGLIILLKSYRKEREKDIFSDEIDRRLILKDQIYCYNIKNNYHINSEDLIGFPSDSFYDLENNYVKYEVIL